MQHYQASIDSANLSDSMAVAHTALVDTAAAIRSSISTAGVTSVSGVVNRTTVTNPTTTPIVDISASYVGQTSIHKLGTIDTAVYHGSTIEVAYGGTGLSSYTSGDMLYASTAFSFAKLAAGTNNYVLTMLGGLPQWSPPATSGTVTSVATDATLTGGTITGSGTLGLNLANPNVFTAAQAVSKTMGTAVNYGQLLINPTAAASASLLQNSPYTYYGCSGWNSTSSVPAPGYGRIGLLAASAGGSTSRFFMDFDVATDSGATWTTWMKYAPSPSTVTFTGGTTLANVATINNGGGNITITPNNTLTIGGSFLQINGSPTIAVGKSLKITEGTNGNSGVVTLVAGVATISNTTVTANTRVIISSNTPAGTIGATYKYTVSAGASVTITAETSALITQTLDTSTLTYVFINS